MIVSVSPAGITFAFKLEETKDVQHKNEVCH